MFFFCLIPLVSRAPCNAETRQGLLVFSMLFGINVQTSETHEVSDETSRGRRGGGTGQEGDKDGRGSNEGHEVKVNFFCRLFRITPVVRSIIFRSSMDAPLE